MPKISQLASVANVTSDDLFVVINDPSGTPSTRKVTAQGLLEFVDSGLGVTQVSGGGTGATNASAARTNLQVPYTFGTGGTSVVAWQSGDNLAGGDWCVVGGGKECTATGNYATLSGGRKNFVGGEYSSIGGGGWNTTSGNYCSVLGGNGCVASNYYATVGGGNSNTASGQNSVVGGGQVCSASGNYSSIVGGENISASGNYSSVGGGYNNTAIGDFSFIGSGNYNTAIGSFSSIPAGQNNIANHNNVFLLGSNLTSDAANTTYVENLKVRNNLSLSTPLGVAYGGTGTTSLSDFASGLGFGSLASQNMDNVTITGGTISINGLFNVGLSLSSNTFSTAKMSARSPITNFKTVGDTSIFTVPSGYMFLIDTMEIVTTTISGASTAPKVRFGVSGSEEMFYASNTTTSNSFGSRHVIENPQNGVDAGSVITFGVAESSTATSHYGAAIVTGYLLKKT